MEFSQAGGSVRPRGTAPAARGRDHLGPGRGGDCGGGIGGTAVGNEQLQPHPCWPCRSASRPGSTSASSRVGTITDSSIGSAEPFAGIRLQPALQQGAARR